MDLFKRRKQVVVIFLFISTVALQSFIPQAAGYEGHGKAQNLQVIHPDISHEDLMTDMKTISISLGVECRFCHVVLKEGGPGEKPVYDAASDDNKEKVIARKMMLMTVAINTDYISGLSQDHVVRQITCITCHRGQVKPLLSIDSLYHYGGNH